MRIIVLEPVLSRMVFPKSARFARRYTWQTIASIHRLDANRITSKHVSDSNHMYLPLVCFVFRGVSSFIKYINIEPRTIGSRLIPHWRAFKCNIFYNLGGISMLGRCCMLGRCVSLANQVVHFYQKHSPRSCISLHAMHTKDYYLGMTLAPALLAC